MSKLLTIENCFKSVKLYAFTIVRYSSLLVFNSDPYELTVVRCTKLLFFNSDPPDPHIRIQFLI